MSATSRRCRCSKRTLFSIDCKTGVKIQHLSAFATEAEVLILSGARFEVAQTLSTGELTIVNLKEIGSGLLQMVPGEAASAAAQPHRAPSSPQVIKFVRALLGYYRVASPEVRRALLPETAVQRGGTWNA